MRRGLITLVVAGIIGLAGPLYAGQAAKAPKGATAACKDGTYSTAKTQQGACSAHGGVAKWLAGTQTETTTPAATTPRTTAASKDTPSRSTAAAKTNATTRTNKPDGATGECKDG